MKNPLKKYENFFKQKGALHETDTLKHAALVYAADGSPQVVLETARQKIYLGKNYEIRRTTK